MKSLTKKRLRTIYEIKEVGNGAYGEGFYAGLRLACKKWKKVLEDEA